MEIKNILISGKPGCGKTSLIMEIIKELDLPAQGFYTQEIRDYNPLATSSPDCPKTARMD